MALIRAGSGRRAAAAAALLVATAAPALGGAFGIAPPILELALDRGTASDVLHVINVGSEPLTLDVSVHNWMLDENNQVTVLPPDEQSLDRWMIVSPLKVTVPPRESRSVRVAVRPAVRLLPGEHRAIVFFETAAPQRDPSTSMLVTAQMGVAVYGSVGPLTRWPFLEKVGVATESGHVTVTLDVASLGNANVRLRANYALWRLLAYPGADAPVPERGATVDGLLASGEVTSRPVLPGCHRVMPVQVGDAVEPGTYVLVIRGTLGDMPVAFDLPVEVHAPAPTRG